MWTNSRWPRVNGRFGMILVAKGRMGERARPIFRPASFSLALLGQPNAARDA